MNHNEDEEMSELERVDLETQLNRLIQDSCCQLQYGDPFMDLMRKKRVHILAIVFLDSGYENYVIQET